MAESDERLFEQIEQLLSRAVAPFTVRASDLKELAGLEVAEPEPGGRIRVWYHGEDCRDGFGAAYAAWRLWGDRATYVPVSHGAPPPPWEPGDAVYVLDFSYDRETLLKIDAETILTVIDHHESARQDFPTKREVPPRRVHLGRGA